MINIQNTDDNECIKWCLVRYLYPEDHNPARITKADKDFAKRIDFKGIKFLVKIRDIHKIKKKKKKKETFPYRLGYARSRMFLNMPGFLTYLNKTKYG